MSEQSNNENETEKKYCTCNSLNSWTKVFIVSIAVCIGTFLAVYFVANQMLKPPCPYKMMDKMFEEQEHDMHRLERQFKKTHLKMMKEFDETSAPISLWEEDDDEYKLIIFLKYFDNNIDNLKFNITPKKITITGNMEKENKNSYSSLVYSHTYQPDEKIDIKNIKKEIHHNKAIIHLPFEEKS